MALPIFLTISDSFLKSRFCKVYIKHGISFRGYPELGISEFVTRTIETERICHWLLIDIWGPDHESQLKFDVDMSNGKID